MRTNKSRIVCRKETYGKVVYNNGEFAEIQTIGIEGVEEGLLLDTVQFIAKTRSIR